MTEEQSEAALDELRRSLYRRAADARDLERYEALRDELHPPVSEPAAGARPGRPGRPGRGHPRRVVLAAIVAVASLLTLALSSRPGALGSRPSASSALDPVATGPVAVRVAYGGARLAGLRTAGSGSITVPVDARSAPQRDGRLLVELGSSVRSTISWYAARIDTGSDRDQHVQVVARSAPSRRSGTAAEVVAYEGAPPRWIVVEARGGVAWVLTTAVLDPG